jgi:hypothetical protein
MYCRKKKRCAVDSEFWDGTALLGISDCPKGAVSTLENGIHCDEMIHNLGEGSASIFPTLNTTKYAVSCCWNRSCRQEKSPFLHVPVRNLLKSCREAPPVTRHTNPTQSHEYSTVRRTVGAIAAVAFVFIFNVTGYNSTWCL